MPKPKNTNLLSQLNDWATTQETTAEKVLKKALDGFYSRALNDSLLSRFFEDVDVTTLKKRQYSFMEKLFGNEETDYYTSGPMIEAHLDLIRNRGLRPIHFDYFIESFMTVFREQKVHPNIMNRIHERLLPLRKLFTQATTQYTMDREERLFFALDDDADGTIHSKNLEAALLSVGLPRADDRLSEVYRQLDVVGDNAIDLDGFSQIIGASGLLVENALRGTLAIPDFKDFSRHLDQLYDEVEANSGGEQAQYIPPLAEADPEKFGVAVVTTDGQLYSRGDFDVDFSIQSMCKPFNYCFAIEELGADEVHRHVGTEPSGRAFNNRDLMARIFENTADGQTEKMEIPFNPMINAGAIMTASLIRSKEPYKVRLRHVREQWGRLIGRRTDGSTSVDLPRFNKEMARQENFTGYNNLALGYLLMATGKLPSDGSPIPADAFPHDPDNYKFITEPAVVNALKLYFSTCSIELTATEVAMAAATLANGGVCPTTQKRVLEQTTVRSCLAVTQMCGMYDGSGDFFYRIGLPAKSGVGGGVLLVVPKLMGVCIFSPRLDAQGNSVRGVDLAKRIIKEYRLHTYDGVMTGTHRADPRIPMAQWRASNCSEALWAASKGDIRTLERLHSEQFDLEHGDYDKRTPMHLAAAEGHIGVVKFLIERDKKPIPDRWGGYPIADAKENGHVEIVEILKKMNLPQESPVHLVKDPEGPTNSSVKFADELLVVELLWAAAENDVSGLRRLVAKGVPVHAEDYDKRTALHLAASDGALDAAKYLVAHGHPLNVRDRWKATPLDEARRENRKELINYLTNKISEQAAATDG